MTDETKWITDYYSGAIGLKIVGVEARPDDNDPWTWPVLICEDAKGERVELEVGRDEEGNGPGFLFGLPDPYAEQRAKNAAKMGGAS